MISRAIAVSWGGIEIHWYGLVLAVSLIFGYVVFKRLCVRQGLGMESLDKFFVQLVVWGFIGARLYHVINELGYYLADPKKVFFVWQGGLAVHGAIFAGLVYVIFFVRKYKINFWKLADIVSPPLLLGQAIGRWGNYFNEELFGRPSSQPWAIYISPENRPQEYLQYSRFHPTFLYEFIWDFTGFLVILWVHKHLVSKKASHGRIFAIYLIIYSLGRIGVEFLRIDDVPIILGLRLPLIVSVFWLIMGVSIILKKIRPPLLIS